MRVKITLSEAEKPSWKMIHAFTYLHNQSPLYFLWDVESGSLHNVDEAAFLVCKNIYGLEMTDTERAKLKAVPAGDADEIYAELKELETQGCLNAPEKRVDFIKPSTIKAMCLHICHDCNLKCSYCFAKEGTYNTARDYMSYEVGAAALDFLFKNSGKIKHLEVDFFGGEPLMNFDVVKRLVAYGKQKAAENGKEIAYTLTTNGVLLNDDAIAYLNSEMDNVVISLDGRKCIHDKLRITRNDKGSYDLIVKNALKFRAVRGDKKYYMRGTFTANNLDFADDALHVNDLGFDQISLEPVVLEDSSPLALRKEHLAKICEQYDILAEEYIKRRKTDKWFNFFHYMIDLENGPCVVKRLHGCGAGVDYVAVTPVGDIYPCHQFVGGSQFYMGNVLDGTFDREIQKTFRQINVYKKEDCGTCFAKYYCSGGCLANSYHFEGDLLKSHKLSCEMMRKRFENSLAVYAVEKEEQEK